MNILVGGIQFATAQLPFLELMDCGMTVSDPNSDNPTFVENPSPHKTPGYNQKMFIKHKRLKKLSLWGCSSLDVRFLSSMLSKQVQTLIPSSHSFDLLMQALFLNCPELMDLNLNLCSNLHPESLVLQCPKSQLVYASGCQGLLTGAIRKQVIP